MLGVCWQKSNHFAFQQQNKSATEYIEGSKARIVQYEQEVKQHLMFSYRMQNLIVEDVCGF